jgi:hypothetical protein
MMTDPAETAHRSRQSRCLSRLRYHKIYSPEETIQTVNRELCGWHRLHDCVSGMSERRIENLSPLPERRREYAARTDEIKDITADGNQRARAAADQTMEASAMR